MTTHCLQLYTRDEYKPEYGIVIWWLFQDGIPIEMPWVGTPQDPDWPGYHKLFSFLPKKE